MPPDHRSSFDVRFDECDAYGLINNPNLIRYMHESGIRADQALGLPRDRPDGRAWAWMAGHLEAAFLKPVHYGEAVEVTTRISSVIPEGWQRAYEVRHRGEHEILALGRILWHLADRERGQRQALPDEIQAILGRAQSAGQEPAWEVSPPSTATAPEGALHRLRSVAWRDVDPQGFLNIAAILDYMTDAGIAAGAEHGWTLARCQAEGIAFVVREHVVDYRMPTNLEEILDMSTWLSDVRRSTGLRHYRLQRQESGDIVATGHTRWVVVRPDTMRPSRLPASFGSDFEGHISN